MSRGLGIAGVCWTLLLVVWAVLAITAKRTRQRDRPTSQIWYRVPTVLAYFLMFAPAFGRGVLGQRWIPGGPQQQALGTVLTVAGIFVAIWARLCIGTNWSGVVTIKENHQLIRTGPYAWVRHPIYSGLILAMAGTAILTRRIAGVLAVLMLATAFFFKSKIEEQFMRRTFGPEYDAYCQRTGAFLPHM